MMHKLTIGMMRVRNEDRWLPEVLGALAPCVDQAVILDDHSTDSTEEIIRSSGFRYLRSPFPFETPDEGRDKNFLMKQVVAEFNPGWIICIDGDELLEKLARDKFRKAIDSPEPFNTYRCQILYAWNDVRTIRIDGVYGRFRRGCAFKVEEGASFRSGLHCSNCPTQGRTTRLRDLDIRLLHFGYMFREDRVRKFRWYSEQMDPENRAEDFYRHMVIGDLPEFPETKKFKHGGPLQTERLNELDFNVTANFLQPGDRRAERTDIGRDRSELAPAPDPLSNR